MKTELPNGKQLPKQNGTLEDYKRAFTEVKADKVEAEFEKRLGYLAWYRGNILQRMVSSPKVKAEEYNQFLKDNQIGESTAYFWRAIANKFTERQVKGKTQMELR